MRKSLCLIAALAAVSTLPHAFAQQSATAQGMPASSLAGRWTLVAADVIRPDGTRERDYGAQPKGRLMIDAQGFYSLQIFKAERPRFASPDKSKGSAEEFAAAVNGSSTHYGRIDIDAAKGQLVFHIEGASFPNWEGTVQRRDYTYKDGELSYRVPARPDGVPLSVWRREP